MEKIEKTRRRQGSVYLQFTRVVMVVMLPDQGHLNPGLREDRFSHILRRNILGGDESTHTLFLTSAKTCWFSDCVDGAALTRCNIVGNELKDVTQGSAHSSVVECWPNIQKALGSAPPVEAAGSNEHQRATPWSESFV